MAVVIKELVIRAEISDATAQSGTSPFGQPADRELEKMIWMEECIEQILAILDKKNKR